MTVVVVALGRRLGRESGSRGAPVKAVPDTAESVDAVLLGCHGGAGTSTLATLLGTPWDLGGYTPQTQRIETFGRPLLLVTRDSAPASARTVEAVTGLSGSGAAISCLVVIADGSGPEPREAAVRFRLVEDRVGRIVRFPFVAGLRYADTADADKVRLPRKAERALAEIREVCAATGSAASDTKGREE
ncbi:hypothetical protein [Thermobifida halotolerans]|uniref:hypothetical protein n=1 Tax=Thermobifida halotolerans TaxID=483545 RepID=UPI001F2646A8|nr:hypothetical protein [Thermobifida halotolerans]